MATEDLFIIAIELGSSKVTGVGGKKMPDGSIQVEVVVQEPSSAFIRNGMIFNMDKSTQCIQSIIKRLQEQLKRTISQVYVGYSGQSIRSQHNTVIRHFDGEIVISKEIVDGLMKENLNADVGDRDILEVIPQEYGVGTQKQIDPVGVLSDHIEGRFLNIVARSSLRANIDNCFAKVGIHVVEDKLIPLIVADEVLSDTERRSGCVLVDFGANTTTVSVYKANLLRFISVIPLGSNNITKDIMSCQLEENEAEELKLTFGVVATDMTEEEGETPIYTLPDGSTIDKKKLYDIIEARTEEILYNVKDQIAASGFGRESLVAGAWLIGGGVNMKNFTKAFSEITGFDKVKIAKNSRTTVHYGKNMPKNTDGQLLGAISLLAKGTQVCTGATIDENKPKDMFGEDGTGTSPQINDSFKVVEPTQQEEGTLKEPEQEEPQKPKKPKREGPGFFKKAWDKFKRISDTIVEDD